MKTKYLWALLFVVPLGWLVWSTDPLSDGVNFIIAGSIPGTNEFIGVWQTLFLAIILMWLIGRVFKKIKFQMLRHTAQQIKADRVKKSPELSVESQVSEFDHSKRSVIAARN